MDEEANNQQLLFDGGGEEGDEIEDKIYTLNQLQYRYSECSEPPALSYSYSGMSNMSSNQDLYYQSKRKSEECCEVVSFIRAEQLFSLITKLLKEVEETLSLQEDIVLYILYYYKWSKEKIYENYFQKLSHLFNKKNSLLQPQTQNQVKSICSVCQEQKLLLKNCLCEHGYCWGCWNGYLGEQLKSGNIFFSCMDSCEHCPILYNSFIKVHFPNQVNLFLKIICINFARFNKNISYCPGGAQSCDYFAQVLDGIHLNTIECVCGQFYCFSCENQPHFPASCSDVRKWEEVLNSEEGNVKWISQNTKKCPSCSALVYKYIGCSYIKCVCGTQFCYNCSDIWDQIHQLNKGECLKLKKKKSLAQTTKTHSFLQLQETIMSINLTMKKNIELVKSTVAITEMYGFGKFQGITKDLAEGWYTLKWGLICLFLYKKNPVEQFIENEFISSINCLTAQFEKLQKLDMEWNTKQIIELGDEIMCCRQNLKKNLNFWVDAWRNC